MQLGSKNGFRYNGPMIQYHIKPTLVPTVVTLILITLFLNLSHWQWSKAERRRSTEQQIIEFSDYAATANLTLAEVNGAFQRLQGAISDAPIKIEGHFLPNSLILWDNRVYNKQSGYHLITLLRSDSSPETLLPVNLGWHPLINGRRQELPTVEIPQGRIEIDGHLFVPHANRFVLDDTIHIDQIDDTEIVSEPNSLPPTGVHNSDNSPSRYLIQRFDADALSKLLQINVLPYTLRVDSISPKQPASDQLTRIWDKRKNIGISADKHQGYALQWLSFAVILLALYLGLNIKRLPEK